MEDMRLFSDCNASLVGTAQEFRDQIVKWHDSLASGINNFQDRVDFFENMNFQEVQFSKSDA